MAAQGPAYERARVEVVWNGATVGQSVLHGGAPLRITRRASASGYLRVHVWRNDGQPLAITNPIWLEVQ